MKMKFVLAAATLACALVAAPANAAPQAKAAPQATAAPKPPTNDDCLACHGDPDAKRANGRSVAVLPQVFGGSIHGQAGIACIDCHTDLAKTTDFPHADTLAPVTCATCHGDAAAQYDQSVHASARRAQAGSVAATCKDCHGTHDIKPAKDPDSRTYHLNLPATCGRCHGNAEIIRRGRIQIGNVYQQFQDSIHGQALAKGGLLVAPACSDCHGFHDIRRENNPESRVFRTNVPTTCGKCHEGIEHKYESGVHGAAMKSGNPLAPVCNNCHTAHRIQRVDLEGWKLQVLHECGNCHTEAIRTYRDTFHGQVTTLGFVRVAACADCHGSHEIYPKRDPRSSISDANRVSTCQRCHPGATASFAKYDPHADRHNRTRNPMLFYASRFMNTLLIGVFAFFGIHTTMWFSRAVVAKRKRRQTGAGGEEEAGDE